MKLFAFLMIIVGMLAGCTHIEDINVLTVATNCDVLRDTSKQAQGEGAVEADVVTRSGKAEAAAAMAEAFASSIYCKSDVISGDARIKDTNPETAIQPGPELEPNVGP